MKKILKSLVLAFVCVLGVCTLAACNEEKAPEGHVHSTTDKWSSDATKHWHACSGCDELVDKEAHQWGKWIVDKEATEDAKGSQHRVCSVCEYEGKEDIPMLDPELGVAAKVTAVYAQVPVDWEEVNIYYWGDDIEADYKVGWPGKEMTLVDAKSNLWGFKVPAGTENVIFNTNGGSLQTVDIPFAVSKNLYVLDELKDGKYTSYYSSYTPKDTDPELNGAEKVEIKNISLLVMVPEDWETCNVYYFGTPDEPKWPGKEMTLVDEERNVYMLDVPETATVIFNNGDGVQTVDLKLFEGMNMYVLTEKNDEGKYEAQSGWYDSKKDEFTPVSLLTMYVQVPEDWEAAYIYFWGVSSAPSWPGVKMTAVDAEKGIYSYVLLPAVNTVIFTNGAAEGTIQTVNLEISKGVNGFVLTEADAEGHFNAQPSWYEDGVFTEVEVEQTTPEFYVLGSMNSWSANDAYKLVIDGDTATLEVELEANAEFKVATANWSAEFGWGKFEAIDGLADKGGNIQVVTAGTYVITVTDLNGTPTLTITLKA